MREIKFRAWNILKKRMSKLYPMQILSNSDVNDRNELFFHPDFDWDCHQEHSVIMQFTGLQNKNGKDIYEGDIVGIPYITPFGHLTDKIESKKIIEYENGCFGIRTYTSFHPIQSYLMQSDGEYISNEGCKIVYGKCCLEIICNIHENKELLK